MLNLKLKKYKEKQYSDELHVIDGIILTIFLSLFIFFNFATLKKIDVLDLVLLLGLFITVLLVTILTIKNIIIYKDEMQISFLGIITIVLTIINDYFFLGIISFWFLFSYFLICMIIFFRNFILKLYYNKENIHW